MTTLKEFVASSLSEVHDGILDAKRRSGTWIAPGKVADKDVWGQQLVTFDVAVTTTTEGSGTVGIKVVNLSGGRTQQAVNRIQFSVPVYFEAINDTPNA